MAEAERALVGVPLESAGVSGPGEIAARVVEPFADLNGSVDYKRNLIRVFVDRCCDRALERLRAA